MLTRTHPDVPLVVAANRDELLDRPAVPMTVLREAGPRILGGRDELAGGTWLAVNDSGVVAGLTNRPMGGERDPSKRSRGELPLALTRFTSAAAAVEAFAADVRPSDYNPSWILVGDRDELFAIDMTVTEADAPLVERLPAGVHILENRPFHEGSPKVDHVRRLLEAGGAAPDVGRLRAGLGDHVGPADYPFDNAEIPPQVKAACVHTERYGTRWSGVVAVPASGDRLPDVRFAGGAPCQTPYGDAGSMWTNAG